MDVATEDTVLGDFDDDEAVTKWQADEQRSTSVANYHRDGSSVYSHGMEGGRAFSFFIDETTGLLTVAVARNGLSVSACGACTGADVRAAK